MGERINHYVDRFIFEMDDKDKAYLILKICLGLTAFYAALLVSMHYTDPFRVLELVDRNVFKYYTGFWIAGFAVFALLYGVLRTVGKERLSASFSNLIVLMSALLFLGLMHWVGPISSVVVCLIPMTLALGVPFFGHRASTFAVLIHVSFAALLVLEYSGVVSYAPLGVNTVYENILRPGNIAAALFWVVGTSFMIYIFSFRVYSRLSHVQAELKSQYDLVRIEQEKNEALLANILPQKVIADLKEHGKTKPETFEGVSVFFSDIVGFTSISSTLKPADLIEELSDMFSEFDEIMETHGCERIKTIGDAYMAVAGFTDSDPKANAKKMVQASAQIIEHLKQRAKSGGIDWKIRVGIHSGDIVGGIVGNRKYLYDVFGDTVNTASRMESNSEVMRINVSEHTRALLGDAFEVEERGAFQIKGKGSMKMFFVGT